LKTVNLKFIGQYTKFTDMEEFEFSDESLSVKMPNPNVDNERYTRGSRMNDMADEDPF
jgi:hypothetical protein